VKEQERTGKNRKEHSFVSAYAHFSYLEGLLRFLNFNRKLGLAPVPEVLVPSVEEKVCVCLGVQILRGFV
jgi:hypothetical protein